MTKTEVYKCDKCNEGEVNAIVTETKKTVSVKVGKCSNCKYSFGIKQISNLTQL